VLGHIPDDDFVLLGKVFNLMLEKTMIHGSPMGKHNTVISLSLHPLVHRTMLSGFYFVFHTKLVVSQRSNIDKIRRCFYHVRAY